MAATIIADRRRPQSNIPIPDPSEITSREITKAKDELRGEFKAALEAVSELAAFRYSERGKIIELFRDLAAERRTEDEKLRNSVQELVREKFHGVEIQFKNVDAWFAAHDVRLKEAMAASRSDVALAMQGAKELSAATQQANVEMAAKAEAHLAERVRALEGLQNVTKDNLGTRINELSSRIDRGDGNQQGRQTGIEMTHQGLGLYVAIAGILVGAVIAYVGSHSGPPISPIVGADTQRVTDLITQFNAVTQITNNRIDALSQRLNELTTAPAPLSAPAPGPVPAGR